MLEFILKYSIRHRYAVLVVTFFAAVAGAFALQRLPIDAVPDITTNQVVVNIEAPALSPLEVEAQLTTPIERGLAGIPGLTQTRSHSWNGLAQITAFFTDETDVYFARQQVTERLTGMRDELPPGVDPKLGGITTGLGDVYMWALEYAHPGGKDAPHADGKPGWQSDGTYLTPEGEKLHGEVEQATYLRTVQDWVVRPQIKSVKDVADVDTQGGYVKQFQVSPDPLKLSSYGLTLKDLSDALERNNTSAGAKYLEHKSDAYTVRVIGRLTNVEQIAAVTITQRNGTPIRVKDVATVGLGQELRTGAGTLNGREVVLGTAQMLIGANSRTVAAAIDAKMATIPLPPDVRYRAILNRTTLVDSTIHTVAKNLIEGALLVVVVLFVLLGNFRAAMIAALAIPLSMLLAASGMLHLKISGNLMSLGAIDFGLIVDGAVIIVENTLRRLGEKQHELGRRLTRNERLDVVFEASKQVRSATAFGEAIIIIVYIPILALLGVAGKMFRPMALTVILALVAAFVLSLTFIPALVATIMTGRVHERENILIRWAQAIYRPALNWSLRVRWVVVAAAVVVFCLSLLLLHQPDDPDDHVGLGREFIPKLDEGDVLAIANRAPSTGLSQSIAIQRSIEKALLEIPEVLFVASKLGTGDAASDPIPMSSADTFIVLKPREQWPKPGRSKKSLVKEIDETLGDVPGSTYEILQPIEDRFNELIADVRTDVAARVVGQDYEQTVPAAKAVYRIVQKLGAKDLPQEINGLEGLPTLQIEVDPEACARYGLSAADVQDVVTAAIGGRETGVIYEGNRKSPIVIRLAEADRKQVDRIGSLPIPLPKPEADASVPKFASAGGPASTTPKAGFVPLSAVAKVRMVDGPIDISHIDGDRNVTVSFNVRDRDVGSFVAEAQRKVQQDVVPNLPAGVSIVWGGQFETMNETWKRLAMVVPLGLLLIVVLLYATFHSVRHAAIVFTGVPLALSGGIVALYLRKSEMNLSISAGVGFIALCGVAVLNGLVMVSFINDLRRQGLPLEEAIRQGSLTRLRPVLMTALVAALGFVPMALATGPGAEVQKPLATVVIGGIISSTLLTLFVLPALYRLLHRHDAPPPTSPERFRPGVQAGVGNDHCSQNA